MQAAYSQLGVPYVWGGLDARRGVGLQRPHPVLLPTGGHKHRHYTGRPAQELTVVPLSQARPGDILTSTATWPSTWEATVHTRTAHGRRVQEGDGDLVLHLRPQIHRIRRFRNGEEDEGIGRHRGGRAGHRDRAVGRELRPLRSAGTDQQTVQEAPAEEAAQGQGAEAPAASSLRARLLQGLEERRGLAARCPRAWSSRKGRTARSTC